MTQNVGLRLLILMPVRDDWISVAELIRQLDTTVALCGCAVRVLMVDDGSLQRCPVGDFRGSFSAVRTIQSYASVATLDTSVRSPLGLRMPSRTRRPTPCW